MRLHLTWLLNTLHLAASYRYLPKGELPTYSYGTKHAYHKYRATILDVPFHVLIVYNGLYCSGTLVRSKIVITAASCLLTDKLKRPIVKIGADTIAGVGQIIPVVDIKIHEYYKYMSRIDNDIAMLVLKEHARFNQYVKKAILVDPEVVLRSGVSIEVSGFGSTNLPQSYVNQLIWTEMLVVDKEECAEAHRSLTTPSNFCARYAPERRLSDSGGPAVYNRQLLVGILSYGGTSGENPHVAIFSNVSYFHRWIQLNTKRFLEKYCIPRTDSSDSGENSDDSDASNKS